MDTLNNYGKPIWLQMFEFNADYNKCNDERKETYHRICKHSRKHDIMICTLNNKPCLAWEGYKHEE